MSFSRERSIFKQKEMQIVAIIEEHAHHFLQCVKTEYTGEKDAACIIQKYLRGGAPSAFN
jgi:hypothetical protein